MRARAGTIPANTSGPFSLLAVVMLAILAILWLPTPAYALDKDGNPVLVALGDSYSAGEGIEPFYDQDLPRAQKLKSQSWIAHRSVLSWPGRLEVPDRNGVKHRMTVVNTDRLSDPKTVLANYTSEKGFHFVASSGAKTENLYNDQHKAYLYTRKDQGLSDGTIVDNELKAPNVEGVFDVTGIDTYDLRDLYDVEDCSVTRQLDVFESLDVSTIDYVTISMGGNDVGFVDIVSTAALSVSTLQPNKLESKLGEAWDYFDEQAREDIKRAYEDIYEACKPSNEAKPNAKILVVGYPPLIDWGGAHNDGGSVAFDAAEAALINNAVHDFNIELKSIVAECREEGMKNIYFVDVETAYFGHEAYSSDPYLNGIFLNMNVATTQNQEVSTGLAAMLSAYSIHPNQKGAQAHADCVQAFIDQIETSKANGENFDAYYDTRTIGEADVAERQIALALDVSPSMEGEPIKQTKLAALKFVDSIAESGASDLNGVSLVSYSGDASLEYGHSARATSTTLSGGNSILAENDDFGLADNEGALSSEQLDAVGDERIANLYGSDYALKRKIQRLGLGSGTNIEAGLRVSYEQVKDEAADKRVIVLMSDGEANVGKTDDELVEYAQSIKDQGVLIYALGFYQSTSDGASVLERIASDGCYYQIDNATQLRYFFGDVADALNGTKFMYVRIACPVDVRVSTSTGTLDSSATSLNTRSDFGSLTFSYPDGESEDPVKVLRLKEGQSYDIEINGTGTGTMDYTIGFVDEQGAYSDMRSFEDVPIAPTTRAAAVAETGDVSVLRVDNDGDGNYDDIYQASANSTAQKVDNTWFVHAVTAGICALVALTALLYGLYCKKTWRVGRNARHSG